MDKVTSTGIKIEATNKHHNQELKDPGRGKHCWIVAGVWVITDPASSNFNLDIENLMTLEGPGCFKCERQYTPLVANKFCQGTM